MRVDRILIRLTLLALALELSACMLAPGVRTSRTAGKGHLEVGGALGAVPALAPNGGDYDEQGMRTVAEGFAKYGLTDSLDVGVGVFGIGAGDGEYPDSRPIQAPPGGSVLAKLQIADVPIGGKRVRVALEPTLSGMVFSQTLWEPWLGGGPASYRIKGLAIDGPLIVGIRSNPSSRYEVVLSAGLLFERYWLKPEDPDVEVGSIHYSLARYPPFNMLSLESSIGLAAELSDRVTIIPAVGWTVRLSENWCSDDEAPYCYDRSFDRQDALNAQARIQLSIGAMFRL